MGLNTEGSRDYVGVARRDFGTTDPGQRSADGELSTPIASGVLTGRIIAAAGDLALIGVLAQEGGVVDRQQGGLDEATSRLPSHDVADLGEPGIGDEPTLWGAERLGQDAAVVIVKRGPNAGSRFRLDQAVTSAGRHPRSDIFLDDATVSRDHAQFRKEMDGYRLVDTGSLNGTYVNHKPIQSVTLANGDEIGMGNFHLVFLARDPDVERRPGP